MAKDLMDELDGIFNEVKDKENVFEGIPDGEYLAIIDEIKSGESKAGDPMVTMIFEITESSNKDFIGRKH